MEKYDLHKNDFTKLHFELKALAHYFQHNKEKASKPHRHSFFQILWFKNSGNHYIDYDVDFRNIKYPRLEFKTGQLILILPERFGDDKDVIKKHEEWIYKKNSQIMKN